jgi:prepilin-type N-terminal cleavage/methylation domain-containing protein
MKITTSRKAGFTLVEIMIVVAIIGMLAAIAIPNFMKARNTAQANACIANLSQIDGAIQQWALEKGKKDSEAVVPSEVAEYLKGRKIPKCPSGGDDYTYGASIADNPTVKCPNQDISTPKHMLQ